MTSSNKSIDRVTNLLCGESTGHRWIPPHKGQWRRALMFPLSCAPEQTVEQTIETPAIWDAVMTSLLCHSCWLSGLTRIQMISSHGTDLGLPAHSAFITRNMNIELQIWTKNQLNDCVLCVANCAFPWIPGGILASFSSDLKVEHLTAL